MRQWKWLAAVSAGFLLTACSTASAPTDSTRDSGSGPDAAAPVVELLSGSAPTVDGDTVELASLRGDVLALWFWAPW